MGIPTHKQSKPCLCKRHQGGKAWEGPANPGVAVGDAKPLPNAGVLAGMVRCYPQLMEGLIPFEKQIKDSSAQMKI